VCNGRRQVSLGLRRDVPDTRIDGRVVRGRRNPWLKGTTATVEVS
jgi:hypothetical protein